MNVVISLLVLAAFLLYDAAGISFSVGLTAYQQRKCFGQELSKGTVLVVEVYAPNSSLEVHVSDPSGKIFSDTEKERIRTAFTTSKAGAHMICVQNLGMQNTNANLSIYWGAQARDYSTIAKKEHLDGLHVTLKQVAQHLRLYHMGIVNLRYREDGLRKTNDSTSTRVITFTVINVLLILGVGVLQLVYFRSFFRSKKVI